MARENKTEGLSCAAWRVLLHSARTAVVAVVSLLVARLFRLPEAYWTPVTTLVIYAIVAGSGACGIGPAFRWNHPRSSGRSDCGELLRVAAVNIRFQRVLPWIALRRCTVGPQRI
jgi:hypothetical protein